MLNVATLPPNDVMQALALIRDLRKQGDIEGEILRLIIRKQSDPDELLEAIASEFPELAE